MAESHPIIVPAGGAAGQAIDYVNPTFYIGLAGFPVTTLVVGEGDTIATPAARTVWFTNASGVDNAAGNATIVAPLSTGAATPATLIFQTGVVGASSATLQTATTGLTLTSEGAVPVANFAGVVGIGTAGTGRNAIRLVRTLTAQFGSATGIVSAPTLIAAANGDTLNAFSTTSTITPGAFTGLIVKGININAMTVATATSPADPVQLDIGILTGTGATNAYGIRIAPPTGAGTNYLIAHTTAAIFNVLASGAITTAAGITAATVSTFNGNGAGAVSGVVISAATAAIAWRGTGGAADTKLWDVATAGANLVFRTLDDASTAPTNWLNVTRVGNGVTSIAFTGTAASFSGTLAVTGAFGCNAAAPQTAFASGGALNAYGAGINGFDTGANASALYAMVVALRAALVANGIMS